MKLLIDIPEENYKLICSDGRPFLPSYKWIKNGIPLDKIRDEIEENITDYILYEEDTNTATRMGDVMTKVFEIIDKYREEQTDAT